MLAAAGMIVTNPYHSAGLLTVASLCVAIIFIRQKISLYKKSLTVVVLFLLSVFVTHDVFEDKKEKDLRARYGTLIAGNNATEVRCASAHDEFDVILGTTVEVANVFPFVLLSIAGDDDFVVDHDRDRLIIKKLRLRDRGGKIVVRIDNNIFEVSDGFHFSHPDNTLQTLAIDNDEDDNIFYLNFLNEHTLLVRGQFRSKSLGKVIANQSYVEIYSASGQAILNVIRITGGCIVSGTLTTNEDGSLKIGGSSIKGANVQINPR